MAGVWNSPFCNRSLRWVGSQGNLWVEYLSLSCSILKTELGHSIDLWRQRKLQGPFTTPFSCCKWGNWVKGEKAWCDLSKWGRGEEKGLTPTFLARCSCHPPKRSFLSVLILKVALRSGKRRKEPYPEVCDERAPNDEAPRQVRWGCQGREEHFREFLKNQEKKSQADCGWGLISNVTVEELQDRHHAVGHRCGQTLRCGRTGVRLWRESGSWTALAKGRK